MINSKVNDMDAKNVKIISVNSASEGMNFMDGLALLLIGLKLTDHLDNWTWIEILSPLWAPMMVAWFLTLLKKTLSDSEEEE